MPRITPISGRRLVRLFEKAGFTVVRVRGDHIIMTREGCPRPLVIPDRSHLPVFIIRNNLRSAGIARQEYFRLLAES